MIAFATMFLGLVLGLQPVTVVVGPEVAAVELRLDGAPVATLTGPPWSAECDFGSDLVPQVLEAVALDDAGQEIARARQRINLPEPMADARIVLEQEGGLTTARVLFDSVFRSPPERATVRFDGKPFEVGDALRFELPPFDPDQIHHLSVELEFPDNVTKLVETTFGGVFSDHVGTPQTAVPVVASRGRLPRKADELRGSFLKDGQPLRVLAIDAGPAEVVIVRDLSAQAHLDRLAMDLRDKLRDQWRWAARSLRTLQTALSLEAVSLRFTAQLKKNQHLWLLEPFARKPGGAGYLLEVFPFSPHLTPQDGGVPFLLTTIRPPLEPEHKQRLADAVAVAGRGVAQRDRRRAVVLILGEGADSSALTPTVARRYLKTVHVPLLVWSTTPPSAEAEALWGDIRELTTATQFEREIKKLAVLLDRQSIVWLEGFHLPQQISLRDGQQRLDFPM